ncbi:MAG: hemagglutinin repeat-containing protein, partial [Magnetospirillum sp.]|nr:hemagglutinin repeat-containing protein [Magnetospirillum sp.]
GVEAVPSYAIDTSLLGGMYANRIRLIATEAGVGVRMKGEAAASAQEFSISALGKIELRNRISAETDVTISVAGNSVSGADAVTFGPNGGTSATISANRDVTITNAVGLPVGDLTTVGAANAGATLEGGTITAGRNLGIQVASLTDSASGAGADDNKRYATGNVTVATTGAASLDGVGYVAGGALSAATGSTGVGASGATLAAGEGLTLTAASGTLSLATAAVKAAGNVTVDAQQGAVSTSAGAAQGIQSTAGNVAINAKTSLTNAGTVSADAGTVTIRSNNSAGSLAMTNSGRIQAAGALDIAGYGATPNNAIDVTNQSGGVLLGATATLTAGTVTNSGTLQGTDGATIAATTLTNNSGGVIVASANASTDGTLTAATLSNAGTIQSAKALTVTGTTSVANSGKLLATTGLTVKGPSIGNSAGYMQAGGALSLSDAGGGGAMALSVTGGTLVAGSTASVNASSVANSGTIQGGTGLSLSASGTVTNNSGGLINTQSGTGTVSAAAIDNVGGTIQSAGALALNTDLLRTRGSGRTLSSGAMTLRKLTSGAWTASVEDNGRMESGGTMDIAGYGGAAGTTALSIASGGAVIAAPLQASLSSLANSGTLQSSGTSQITTTGSIQNASTGSMRLGTDGSAATLTFLGMDNYGTLQSTGGLSLNSGTGNIVNRSTGSILAGGALTVRGQSAGNYWVMNSNRIQGATVSIAGYGDSKNVTIDNTGVSPLLKSTSGNMTLTAGTLQTDALIDSAGQLTVNVDNLGMAGAGSTLVAGTTGDITVANSFTNNGAIHGNSGLSIRSPGLTNSSTGGLSSGGALNFYMSGGALQNNGAIYGSSVWGDFNTTGTFTNSSTGTVDSGGAIIVQNASAFTNNNSIVATGGIVIGATTFTNQGGGSGGTVSWSSEGLAFEKVEAQAGGGNNLSPTGYNGGNAASYFNINPNGGAAPGNYCNTGTDCAGKQVDAYHYLQTNSRTETVSGGGGGGGTAQIIASNGNLEIQGFSSGSHSGGILSGNLIRLTGNSGATFTVSGGGTVDLHKEVQQYDYYEHWLHAPGSADKTEVTGVRGGSSTAHGGLVTTVIGTANLGTATIRANTLEATGFGLTIDAAPGSATPTARSQSGGTSASLASATSATGLSSNAGTTGGASSITLGGITLTLPTNPNGFFVTSRSPNSAYLIETNPRFGKNATYLGSDYLLKDVKLPTDQITRRLGDAAYETTLIRQQLINQANTTVLKGFQNEQQMVKSFYDNAIKLSSNLGLEVGKPLTGFQQQSLKQDIVWLVEVEVKGQKVLAPQVYLAPTTLANVFGGSSIVAENIDMNLTSLTNRGGKIEGTQTVDVTTTGAITNTGGTITGDGVKLASTEGGLTNTGGTIEGKTSLDITAKKDIANTGGTITGGDVKLASTDGGLTNTEGTIKGTDSLDITAKKDIANVGGTITGGTVSVTSTEGSIENRSTTKTETTTTSVNAGGLAATTTTTETKLDKQATISSTGGGLSLKAGKDITNTGGTVKSAGDASLDAGGAITSTALELGKTTTTSTTFKDAKGNTTLAAASTTKETTHAGSSLTAVGDLDLKAGGDITLKGNKTEAGGSIGLDAGGNVTVSTVSNTTSTSTTLTAGGTTTTSQADSSKVVRDGDAASTMKGGDITIKGKDITNVGTVLTTTVGDVVIKNSGTYSQQVAKDSTTRSSTVTDTKGNKTVTNVAADGTKVETKTDAKGAKTETTTSAAGGTVAVKTSADGKTVETTGPDGKTVKAVTKKNADGTTTVTTTGGANGKAVATVSADGKTTTTVDDRGTTVGTIGADGKLVETTTSKDNKAVTIATADGKKVTTTTGKDGKKTTATETTTTNAQGVKLTTTVTKDKNGKDVTTVTGDDGSKAVTKIDASGNKVTEATDAYGDKSTTTTYASGFSDTNTTTADGSKVIALKNASGTLISTTVTSKDGKTFTAVDNETGTFTETVTGKGGTKIVTKGTVDADGNKSVVSTGADGKPVTTITSADGKTVTTKTADGAATAVVTRNDGGKATTVTNADGSKSQVVVDAKGKKTSESTVNAGGNAQTTTYDSKGNPTSVATSNPDGTGQKWTYGSNGKMASLLTVNTDGSSTAQTYDSKGKVTGQVDTKADGETTTTDSKGKKTVTAATTAGTVATTTTGTTATTTATGTNTAGTTTTAAATGKATGGKSASTTATTTATAKQPPAEQENLIKSAGGVTIDSGNKIVMDGTGIKGGTTVDLKAKDDISAIGSSIRGKDIKVASTDGDVVTKSTTKTTDITARIKTDSGGKSSGVFKKTELDQQASIIATDNVSMSAGKNIEAQGTTIQGGGTVDLKATGNVTIGALRTEDASASNTGGKSTVTTTTGHVGSDVSGGTVKVSAGNDLTIAGSDVTSGSGGTTLGAGHDVKIAAVQDTTKTVTTKKESAGWFGLGTKTTNTTTTDVKNDGSDLTSTGKLTIASGNDTTLTAAKVKASGLDINAGGNVSVLDAHDTTTKQSESRETGFGVAGGLFGTEKTTVDSDKSTSVGSTLDIGGNASIKAGNTVTVRGSDLDAKGDVVVKAKDVKVLAGVNEEHETTVTESHSIYKVGGKADADTAAKGKAKAKGGGSATGESGESGGGFKAVSGGEASIKGAAGAEASGDSEVSLWSMTKTTTKTDDVTHTGSTLKSGGKMTIIADNQLTTEGAKVTSGGDMDIQAKEMELLAVKDTHSKTVDSSTKSIGFYQEGKAQAGAEGEAAISGKSPSAKLGAAAGADVSVKNTTGFRMSDTTSKETSETHTGSTFKSGGNMKLAAEGKMTTQAANVDAGGNLTMTAKEMENKAAVDTTFSTTTTKQHTIGMYDEAGADASASGNIGGSTKGMAGGAQGKVEANVEVGRGLGWDNIESTDVTRTATNKVTTFKSGGSMTRTAENSIVDEGTSIDAGGDFTQKAKTIDSKAVQDTTYSSADRMKQGAQIGGFAGASAGAGIDADLKGGAGGGLKEDKAKGNYTAGGDVLAASKRVNTGMHADASVGGKAGYSRTDSGSTSSTSTAVVSNIKSGGKITSTSTEKTTLQGTVMDSTGDTSITAKSLEVTAAENKTSSSDSSRSISAGVKGALSVGTESKGITPGGSIGGSYGSDDNSKSSSKAVVASLTSGGKMTIKTEDDATFEGTKVESGGKTTIASDKGNVTFSAAKDTSTSSGTGLDAAGQVTVGAVAGKDMDTGPINKASANKAPAGKAGGGKSSTGRATSVGASFGYSESDSTKTTAVVGSIKSGGGIEISAGKNATFVGTDMSSGQGEATSITAGENVNLRAAKDTSSSDSLDASAGFAAGKGGGQKSLALNAGFGLTDKDSSTARVASINSGGDLTIKAGKDATLEGSNLAAGGKASIGAGGNVNVKAATSTSDNIDVGASLSLSGDKATKDNKGKNIGANFTGGTSTTRTGATISAGQGVEITAEKGSATFEGTSINTAKGDVDISAAKTVTFGTAQSSNVGGSIGGSVGDRGNLVNDLSFGAGTSNQVTSITGGGNLNVSSGGKTVMQGTTVDVGGKADIDAGGGVEKTTVGGGNVNIGITSNVGLGAGGEVQQVSIKQNDINASTKAAANTQAAIAEMGKTPKKDEATDGPTAGEKAAAASQKAGLKADLKVGADQTKKAKDAAAAENKQIKTGLKASVEVGKTSTTVADKAAPSSQGGDHATEQPTSELKRSNSMGAQVGNDSPPLDLKPAGNADPKPDADTQTTSPSDLKRTKTMGNAPNANSATVDARTVKPEITETNQVSGRADGREIGSEKATAAIDHAKAGSRLTPAQTLKADGIIKGVMATAMKGNLDDKAGAAKAVDAVMTQMKVDKATAEALVETWKKNEEKTQRP